MRSGTSPERGHKDTGKGKGGLLQRTQRAPGELFSQESPSELSSARGLAFISNAPPPRHHSKWLPKKAMHQATDPD